MQVRLRLNNSKTYKYYSLENTNNLNDIEYYTLTKDEKNNKIDIKFDKETFNEKEYSYLGLTVSSSKLPEDVYDFVIDPGHGGTDAGETYSGNKEADIVLDYSKLLKEKLEAKGYKVKLTRDDSNTASFTKDYYADDRKNWYCL